MSERKLASTQKVLEILPIENADAIEIAVINGWNVVVKKNSVSVGDIVVYFEIDSWVPHNIAPFLTNPDKIRTFNGVEGNRLKTKRLRGVISQGLVIPQCDLLKFPIAVENVDLTDVLGIQKWEKELPISLQGFAKGNFPSFVPKTDEERIQNLRRNFESGYLNGEYRITEKLDGTSFTAYFNEGVFGVCSRNIDLKRSDGNTYWVIADQYDLENKMTEYGHNIAIQGEIIGKGIQGNQYGLDNLELRVFKMWDVNEKRYLFDSELREMCTLFGLKQVPDFGTFEIDNSIMNIQHVVDIATGESTFNGTMREGLVFQHLVNTNVHFKAINNEWLLKYE